MPVERIHTGGRIVPFMAKSKNKQRRKTTSRVRNKQQPTGIPWWKIGLPVAAILAAGGLGWSWYADGQSEQIFLEHARRGQSALDTLEKPPDEGRGHGAPGASLQYGSDIPTSGVHDPTWVNPGVYDEVQRREKLVHSLEHGMIVIYYESPGADALKTLTAWTELYDKPWSGIVLAPKPGLGEALVLTAWNRRLRLQQLDTDAAAAFVDAFRGRGPENPVR